MSDRVASCQSSDGWKPRPTLIGPPALGGPFVETGADHTLACESPQDILRMLLNEAMIAGESSWGRRVLLLTVS